MFPRTLLHLALSLLISSAAPGAVAAQVAHRALVLGGGEYIHPALRERFVQLAGGPEKHFIYIPTASSGIRLPSGFEYEPTETDAPNPRDSLFAIELATLFGVRRVEILHTRQRATANSPAFVARLQRADGVWFSGGNAGRLAEVYGRTKTEDALLRLLDRGGVIGGNSAGAIIQGSFIVRGRPDKPVLMAPGRTAGFGFLRDVVVNPHLVSQKRENELISVLDAHPTLLGIGLPDSAGVIVQGDLLEPVGEGRIAIYDNTKHGCCWYYWLASTERFDLKTRHPVPK
jgi:cyanophycinase